MNEGLKSAARTSGTLLSGCILMFGVLDGSSVFAAPQYFGYYASASSDAGSRPDYITETSDHANIAWIRGENDVEKLAAAASFHMGAILEIERIFFDEEFNLFSDFEDRWSKFAARISPYERSIVAFYPLDEPYLQAKHMSMPKLDMKAELEVVAAVIHRSFPGKPVAMIFTWEAIAHAYYDDPFLSELNPKGFDWIGFDCYGSWDNCYGHSIPWYEKQITGILRPGQRSIIFPDSFQEGHIPLEYPQNHK